MNKIDRFLGCMYGLAIGDALGFPVEFMSLNEIKRAYGKEGVKGFVEHKDGFKPGTYSDDTQMSLCIAQGLETKNLNDLDEVMEGVSVAFCYTWLDRPENNRYPGKTCIEGVKRLKEGFESTGLDWEHSGDPKSKGCGAAMRSAPIGLVYDDLEKVIEVAHAVSMCTHAHPTAIAAGIGTACLTYFALHDYKPEDMIDKVCEATEHADEKGEFRAKIRQIKEVWDLPTEEAIKKLGEGWTGEEAVAIALYSFLKNPNDYRKTILTAVNHDGDSDTTGCIAGAISGAYNGIKAIPKEWVEGVENSKGLEKVATRLCRQSESLGLNEIIEDGPRRAVIFYGGIIREIVGKIREREYVEVRQDEKRHYKQYGSVDVRTVERKKRENNFRLEEIEKPCASLSYDPKNSLVEAIVFDRKIADIVRDTVRYYCEEKYPGWFEKPKIEELS